ncbi:MAG: hypothetical protein AVDCRST_MAG36-132, partial [uncultured Nocardioidaceae bacterium]
ADARPRAPPSRRAAACGQRRQAAGADGRVAGVGRGGRVRGRRDPHPVRQPQGRDAGRVAGRGPGGPRGAAARARRLRGALHHGGSRGAAPGGRGRGRARAAAVRERRQHRAAAVRRVPPRPAVRGRCRGAGCLRRDRGAGRRAWSGGAPVDRRGSPRGQGPEPFRPGPRARHQPEPDRRQDAGAEVGWV